MKCHVSNMRSIGVSQEYPWRTPRGGSITRESGASLRHGVPLPRGSDGGTRYRPACNETAGTV
jgi:hypothetical protein